jgi:hypothetical protein
MMCRNALQRQTTLHRALREILLLAAPERLAEAVLREARLARRFAATTRLAWFFSMLFAGIAALSALGAIYWLSALWQPSAETGPLGSVTRRATEWFEAAKVGITGFLDPLVAGWSSDQQLLPAVVAVALAFAGVAFLDLLVGKRLVRRTRA